METISMVPERLRILYCTDYAAVHQISLVVFDPFDGVPTTTVPVTNIVTYTLSVVTRNTFILK